MSGREATTGTADGLVRLTPPREDVPLLALGVLCASTAPALIAATAAPALGIAFWRTGLGTLVVAPVALLRSRAEVRAVPRRILWLAALAGAMLAAHFATFVPSLGLTSVASASALVCSQAVWAGLFGALLGERLPRRAWLGTAVCFAGVLTVTGVDLSLSVRALGGDVLALLGGMFGGAYIVAGGRVRGHLSTSPYTAIRYGVAAVLLLAACLLGGQALAGYASDDWVRILALTVLAQLLGHSVFNFVLRGTSPTVVSLVTLFTVPIAAVIAAVALGQTPPLAALPALGLLLAGTALVIGARGRGAVRPGRRPPAPA